MGTAALLNAALLLNGAVLVGFGMTCLAAPAAVWGADAGAAGTAVGGAVVLLSRLLGVLCFFNGALFALAPVERLAPYGAKKAGLAYASVLCLGWVVASVLSREYTAGIPSVSAHRAALATTAAPLALLAVNCAALMWDLYAKEFPKAEGEAAGAKKRDAPAKREVAENAAGEGEAAEAADCRDEDEEAPLLGDQAGEKEAPAPLEEEGKERKGHGGWMRLLALAKPEHRVIVAGCVALLVRLPFSLAVPHFVAETIGAVQRGDMDAAHVNVALLMAAGTVDALLDFWNFFLFGYAQQRLIKRLRTDLFACLLSQEIGFYDRPGSTGDATSRLQVDTSEMGNDLTWVFRWTIEALGRILGIVVYMFVRDWRLALMSLGVIPFVAVINTMYGRWLSKNAEKVQDAMAKSNGVAQEVLSSIRTVYSFSNQPHAHRGYAKEIETWYQLNVKQMFMQSLYYMVVGTFLVNTCVQAAILYYGSYLIIEKGVEVDVLIAFMLYQSQLQGWVTNLLSSFTNLIKSTGAGAKVFELLDRTPQAGTRRILGSAGREEAEEGGGGGGAAGAEAPDITAESDITFEGVRFKYPTRDEAVLRGINCHLAAGKTSALVGLSGAGKSTLFHLLERFYTPQEGAVAIGGRPIQDFDDVLLHSKIALVGQEPVLFSGTIFSNIVYGVQNERENLMEDIEADEAVRAEYLARVVAAATCANAAEFIEKFDEGYFTEVGERGVQLSGGQKQRVAIARALMQDPQVLLLDEATSALDATSERLVQNALDAAAEGRTTLVIAHRLSTVARAHKILVLQGGAVVEEGTHEELMEKDGAYRKLVARQLQPTDEDAADGAAEGEH